jgi:hypothetical protein
MAAGAIVRATIRVRHALVTGGFFRVITACQAQGGTIEHYDPAVGIVKNTVVPCPGVLSTQTRVP